MLNALKNLMGGSRTKKQAADFEALILAAKEEQSALDAMLAQITLRGSKVAQVGKTLKQFDAKTVATSQKVTDVDKRIAGLEERTRDIYGDRCAHTGAAGDRGASSAEGGGLGGSWQ